MAVTSATPEFYPDGKKTGLHWSEALHPYNVFTEAGFEVDVVAEKPSHFGYDERSISEAALDPESKEAWAKPSQGLRRKLDSELLDAATVDASKYGIFFAAGGLGAAYDFPEASNLHKLAAQVYAKGGVVSAVCHGPAVLPGIHDASSGKPIIQGKKITGFPKKGEIEYGSMDILRKDGKQTIEELVNAAGGHFIEPPTALEDFSITDGRIVSGVNPASAKSTAEGAVKAFKRQ